MKTLLKITIIYIFLHVNLFGIDFSKIFESGNGTISNSSSLQTKGLKEALGLGVNFAIKTLSNDGFLKNQAVKIPLPKSIEKIANIVSKAGGKKYVDNFIKDMNLAAGSAVSKTAPIFAKAITDMSIDDAKKLLSDGDTAITKYFQRKTTNELTSTIKPVVSEAIDKNQLISSYHALLGAYNKNGEKSQLGGLLNQARGIANTAGVDTKGYLPMSDEDLHGYITRKSVDGMFYMIAKEEVKIRKNPFSYGSDIIKKVFGK